MKIVIKNTNLPLTGAIKSYAEEKIQRLLEHFAAKQLVRLELEMLKDRTTKDVFRAEVQVDAPHRVFRAEASAEDLYAAIDLVLPKLSVQIEKFKHKKDSRTRVIKRRIKEGQI